MPGTTQSQLACEFGEPPSGLLAALAGFKGSHYSPGRLRDLRGRGALGLSSLTSGPLQGQHARPLALLYTIQARKDFVFSEHRDRLN